jgi:hypothetical protein
MSRKKPAKMRTKTHKKIHKGSGFTKVFPVIVVVLVLVAIGLGVFTFKDSLSLFWFRSIRPQIVRRIPQPTPTPRPIPHGKISFSVGGSNITGPRFGNGYLDPYDPAVKTNQIVRINVTSATPVVSVYGVMQSDHKSQNFPFTLVSGTETQGEWEGKWLVNDTYLYNYSLEIHAINARGSNLVGMTLR